LLSRISILNRQTRDDHQVRILYNFGGRREIYGENKAGKKCECWKVACPRKMGGSEARMSVTLLEGK
jgi:hypothetical protein